MNLLRCADVRKPNLAALLHCVIPAGAQAETLTPCLAKEQVTFPCRVGTKVVSICASDTLDPASGTAQYRFGAQLKIPAQVQPTTTFSRLGMMRGPARVETRMRVVKGEYAYTVYEGEGKGWQRSGANLSCVSPTQGFSPQSSTQVARSSPMKRKSRWRWGMTLPQFLVPI